jgi:hypothetical protein
MAFLLARLANRRFSDCLWCFLALLVCGIDPLRFNPCERWRLR